MISVLNQELVFRLHRGGEKAFKHNKQQKKHDPIYPISETMVMLL